MGTASKGRSWSGAKKATSGAFGKKAWARFEERFKNAATGEISKGGVLSVGYDRAFARRAWRAEQGRAV